MRNLLASLAILLAFAGPARADRYARGLLVFEQRQCARCHTVGWRTPAPRRGAVDLTQVTTTRPAAELQRWLADPGGVKRETACTHRPLSAEQIDDLLHFLRARAGDAPGKPQPRAAQAADGPLLTPPVPQGKR